MNTFDSLGIELTGNNLIEASAGTGKTYTIASLYVRLVIERDLLPENVLVVTFTEAATKELRDRIRKRIREARDVAAGLASEDPFLSTLISSGLHPAWPGSDAAIARLDRALQTFDCAAISTIHGFCSRALQDNAFESGSLYDTELLTDQNILLQEIVDDFWRIRFFAANSLFLPLARANGWSPEEMLGFLKGKIGNSSLRIIPEFTSEAVANTDEECRLIYADVSKMWVSRHYEIVDILYNHPGLRKSEKCYRNDMLPPIIEAMDVYVGGGNPFAVFAVFEKLASQFMSDNRFAKKDPPEHVFFDQCGKLNALIDRRALMMRWEFLCYVKERLPELKAKRNVRFYDDLLADLYRGLTSPGGEALAGRIRSKYQAALIDEFQDTDQIQYRIFRTLFSDESVPLFLIGDPKQAIYSFRGADIFAYLEARKDIPEERHFTMSQNWRSSGKLVEAVNHLFTLNNKRPLVIDGLDFPEVTASDSGKEAIFLEGRDAAPMQLWFFNRSETDKECINLDKARKRIVNAVGEEIAGLISDAAIGKAKIGENRIVPGDLAVIVRSHKEAALIYNDLLTRGIPAVVRSNQSIFETAEASELSTIIRAVAEPSNPVRIRTALATVIMGTGAGEIARMIDEDGASEWEQRLSLMREYHNLWRERGFMAMFRLLLDREGVRGRLLELQGGERRITNLLHCGELLHAKALEARIGAESLCIWFAENVCSPPKGEEHEIRLESDEKAVKILTIHVSKGLEFPIVFCPFSWGGVVKDNRTVTYHDDYTMVADYGSDEFAEHRELSIDEGLAENMRLLYVALTRAKYRCYMIWGRFRYVESSAIAYLLHAPDSDAVSSIHQNLENVMDGISDSDLLARLRKVEDQERICVTEDPSEAETVIAQLFDKEEVLDCRVMSGSIETDWRVASFSSLADGHSAAPELPDHDGDDPELPAADGQADDGTVFDFPKGAQAGTFLHSVFEKVDFSSSDEARLSSLVSNSLEKSIYEAKWLDPVCKMVRNVLDAELGADGVRLSSLKPGDWLTEMEFYIPLKFISSSQLGDVLKKHGVKSPLNLAEIADNLNFKNVRGMLLGYIDLLFFQDGKYFILDWKSNHLGQQIEDYNLKSLSSEMERKLYPLQYLLYTVAVNRHLEKRSPGYSYETHFGGVLYLFLRGIDLANPGYGVFHDIPSAALLKDLADCLIDCEESA